MLTPVRRLIVKNYYKDGGDMNLQVGQEVYGGHKICNINELDSGDKVVYIQKGDIQKTWKKVDKGWTTVCEYEI